MEKQSKEEFLLDKLMEDAGLEKPSSAFSANVMNAITAKKIVKEYQPLISKRVLIGIYTVVALAVVGLDYMNIGDSPELHLDFNYLKTVSLPKIEFSQTMTFAIAMIALFFIEIPFLKNLLVKQYRY